MYKFILNKNRTLFLVTFSLILIFSGCETTTENVPNDKSTNISSELLKSSNKSTDQRIDLIVKGLVKLLKDKDVRQMLYDEFLTSDKVENILEAAEMLNKKHNIKFKKSKNYQDLKEALADMLEEKDKKIFKTLLKSLSFGDIDIYFPVEGHLNLWNASENLIILGIRTKEENELNELIGYDLEEKEHILSVAKVPATPVMVVCPSEKMKQYNYPSNSENSNEISFAPNLPADLPPSPPDTLYNYKVGAYGVCIAQHYDPWYAGKLEIYLKVKTKIDGGVWTGWERIPEEGYNWIEVDPGHWRYHYQNYPTQEIQLFRADKNFSIQIEIWEYDPNDPDDFVADAYYNQITECGVSRPTNIIRCDFTGCGDYQLLDGVYPGSDYDFLAIRFTKWQ